MFTKLAIQSAGQPFGISLDRSLARSCWNTAAAVTYCSSASIRSISAKPQKLLQASGIRKVFPAKTTSYPCFVRHGASASQAPVFQALTDCVTEAAINQAIAAAISRPLPEQLWPYVLSDTLVMPGSCSTSIALAYFVRCRQELKSPRFYFFIPTYGTLQLHAGSSLPAGPHISMPRHSNPAFQNKAKFNLIH